MVQVVLKRSVPAALAAVVLACVGLVSSAANAAVVPGTAAFSGSGSAHCTTLPVTPPFDADIGASGSNPVAVTVGESITIAITGWSVPGGFTSSLVVVRVRGPVTPSGDITVYSGTDGELVFKATGAGTVTVDLVHTQGYVQTPRATGFTLCNAPAPIPLTSFTATTKPVCLGLPATIVGTSAGEALTGTTGPDVIYAGSGDDVVNARAGDDVVCGAHGSDTIRGRNGRDRIDGGYANDVIHGDDGADWIDGGSGNDTLDGGGGTDTARGGVGTDTCTTVEVIVNC